MPNSNEHDKFKQSLQEYLEDHRYFDLMERLMKSLLIQRPADPVNFLIEQLSYTPGLRIIILGLPGSGRSTQSKMVAKEYGVVHVSVGDLLREEVVKGTPLGMQIKDLVATGQLVPDNLVFDVVKQKLTSVECVRSGWILDGFPRTRIQAQALQKAGLIPDKFILLNVPEQVVVTRLRHKAEDSADSGIKIDLSDDTIRTRIAQFYRHLFDALALYKNVVHNIEGDRPAELVFKDVKRYISLGARTRAPCRPPRILILGPPGSGRTTQCEKLSVKYGVVHVSIANLIKEEIIAARAPGWRDVADLMENAELIPDEIILPLVEQRLKRPDCRQNGWVLDGFPRTLAQAEALKKFLLEPSRVIFLNAPEEVLLARVTGRRYDPLTGAEYNLEVEGRSPQELVVLERLVQRESDSAEMVRKRLTRYNQTFPEIHSCYRSISQSFEVTRDAITISELASDFLERVL